jgi:hypothetical protein
MAKDAVSAFFKTCLDIPLEARAEELSTRKLNQFGDLSAAYTQSVKEGAIKGSAWAALQAITRYADHNRAVRGNGLPESLARFNSAQFGSGDLLKGRALDLLLPLVSTAA